MLDFKSKNRIKMKKNRIRVQSLLRELTADDIEYTRYTKGNRYVTFGFYRYPTLEFIEQTYVYNGGNHRRLMRAKILELIPSTFMQNGRLRKRFVKGVDYIKFEPKPGSVFNVLGRNDQNTFPGYTFLNQEVKKWYRDNWDFITEGYAQGGVEITIHYGESGYEYQNVYSVEMMHNLLWLVSTFAHAWNEKLSNQRSFYWWHYFGKVSGEFQTYFFAFPYCKIIVAKTAKLKGEHHIQSFLASKDLSHCFFKPILKWAENLVEESKDKGKRTQQRYRAKVRKIEAYLKQYEGGVPETALQGISDDLKLDFSITLPLHGINKKNHLLDVACKGKRIKHFKFVNTRFNHLDLALSNKYKTTLLDYHAKKAEVSCIKEEDTWAGDSDWTTSSEEEEEDMSPAEAAKNAAYIARIAKLAAARARKRAYWCSLDITSANMMERVILDTPEEMREKLDEIASKRLVPVFVSQKEVVQSITDVFDATQYELQNSYNIAASQFENEHYLFYNHVYENDGLAEKMISAAIHFSTSAVDFNNPWVKYTQDGQKGVEQAMFCEPTKPAYENDYSYKKYKKQHKAWTRKYGLLIWCARHKLRQSRCAKSKKDIFHIDQKKAYFNFRKCPFYDGFLGRWSDVRVCEVPLEDAKQTAGFYVIDELDFSQCKFPEHVKDFNCYRNNHLYAHPEIKFMHEHLGLRFKIIAGVWGPKMDLKFPDSMKDKMDCMNQPCRCKEKNKPCECVPHYARWVGINSLCSPNKKLQFLHHDDNHKLLGIMSDQLKRKRNIDVQMFMGQSEFVSFSYPKPKDQLRHRRHIVSYITAYCRITTIMQALEVNYSDLIRVHADGIYIDNTSKRYNDIRLIGSFRPKEDRMGERALVGEDVSVSSYIPSGTWVTLPNRKDEYLKYHDATYLKGAGGTGKTYQTLRDEAYGKKTCYAPHSNKLCADTFKEHSEFMKHRTPYSNILRQLKTNEHERLSKILSCNHLLCDEVSFWTYSDIKRMMEFGRKYCIKISFIGDIGYQVPPCIGTNDIPVPAKTRLALFNGKRKVKLPSGKEIIITTTTFDWAKYIHDKTGIRNYM